MAEQRSEKIVVRTGIGTTKWCYVQGEGTQYKKFPPVFKTNLILEDAAAVEFKEQADEIVRAHVEPDPGREGHKPKDGTDLKKPAYKFDEESGRLELSCKVKIEGEKQDGTKFRRVLPVIDAKTGDAIPDEVMVGGGSLVQLALEAVPWNGFGTVGLAWHPLAVVVHEARTGTASPTRRTNSEWLDFVTGDDAGEVDPSTVGDDI